MDREMHEGNVARQMDQAIDAIAQSTDNPNQTREILNGPFLKAPLVATLVTGKRNALELESNRERSAGRLPSSSGKCQKLSSARPTRYSVSLEQQT